MATRLLAFGLFVILSSIGCSPQTAQKTSDSSRAGTDGKKQLPSRMYYGDPDLDGQYEEVEFDRNPEPRQGQEDFAIDFYSHINYPASARERGIQGIVTLLVTIDALGNVNSIEVEKSLCPDCDLNAINAFRQASRGGFQPAILHGQAVPSQIEWHVGFWLE